MILDAYLLHTRYRPTCISSLEFVLSFKSSSPVKQLLPCFNSRVIQLSEYYVARNGLHSVQAIISIYIADSSSSDVIVTHVLNKLINLPSIK